MQVEVHIKVFKAFGKIIDAVPYNEEYNTIQLYSPYNLFKKDVHRMTQAEIAVFEERVAEAIKTKNWPSELRMESDAGHFDFKFPNTECYTVVKVIDIE